MVTLQKTLFVMLGKILGDLALFFPFIYCFSILFIPIKEMETRLPDNREFDFVEFSLQYIKANCLRNTADIVAVRRCNTSEQSFWFSVTIFFAFSNFLQS